MPKSLDCEREVREKLIRYLQRRVPLRAFLAWFVPATWEVDESSPRPLRELVFETKLRLAEYTNGHWPEGELREKLRAIVSNYQVTFAPRRAREAGEPKLMPSSSSRNRDVAITASRSCRTGTDIPRRSALRCT